MNGLPASMKKKHRATGYLKTLDGWRTVAILSVIAFHDDLYSWGAVSDRWLHSQGFLGVDLFFCISGLLICYRLIDEEKQMSRISLKRFYIRRTFRIVPPMLVFLICIAILASLSIIRVGVSPWISSILFVRNYYEAFTLDSRASIYTNHFWSLAVEEHFYLILPALLVYCARYRIRVLAGFTALCVLWNMTHTFMFRHDPLQDYANARTDLRLQELLFPAMLAVLLHRATWRRLLKRHCRPVILFPLTAIVAVVGFRVSHGLTCNIALPICFSLLIVGTVLNPDTWTGRFLEWSPIRSVGRLSYSIYLWQQLFFVSDQKSTNNILGRLQHHPWNICMVSFCAITSYLLIERPSIRFGHRLAPPASPGHSNIESFRS